MTDHNINEAALERYSQMVMDEMFIKFGKLSAAHPVRQYIDKILTRLPRKDGFDLKLTLCPGWKEVNAVALPSGDILAGCGIIDAVNNEETILGIIAHEYIHVSREHLKHLLKVSEKSVGLTEYILKNIALARTHEYESDLRSVLRDLEEAGINPTGYKNLFFPDDTKTDSTSLSHGSDIDRSLNIATTTHFVDLNSLQTELHDIPEDIKALNKNLGYDSEFSPIWRRPKLIARDEEELKIGNQARRQTLEKVPKRLLPLLIGRVAQHTARHHAGRTSHDPEDLRLLRDMINKFKLEFKQELTADSEEDSDLKLILALEVYCGVDIFNSKHTAFPEFTELLTQVTKSPADLERMRTLFTKLDLPYFCKSSKELFIDLINFAIDNQLFGAFNKIDLDFDQLKITINAWSKTFADLSREFDVGEIYTEEFLRKVILTELKTHIGSYDDPSVCEFSAILGEKLSTITDNAAEQAIKNPDWTSSFTKNQLEIIKDLYRVKSLQTLTEKSHRLSKLINAENSSLDINGLDQLLRDIYLSLVKNHSDNSPEYFAEFIGPSGELINPLGLDVPHRVPHFLLYSAEYVTKLILEDLLETHAAFNSLSDIEKKAILFYTTKLLFDSVDTAEIKESSLTFLKRVSSDYYPSEDEDDEDDRIYKMPVNMQKEGSEILKIVKADLNPSFFYESHLTIQDLELLHNRLVKDPLLGKAVIGEQEFTQLISHYLSQLSFTEMFTIINDLKARDIDLQSYFERHPKHTSPLLRSITKAIKQDTLGTLSLLELTSIATWINDPLLRTFFEKLTIEKSWDRFDFADKISVIFPTEGQNSLLSFSLRNKFLEEDIKNKADFDTVKNHFESGLDKLTHEGDTRLGLLFIFDTLFPSFKYTDTAKLLASLLRIDTEIPQYSGTDRSLKNFFYENLKDIEKDKELASTRKTIIRTEKGIRSIFNLDFYGKNLLLRKLLTAEGGILRDNSKKAHFLDIVFNNWIKDEESEQDLNSVLGKVKTALAQSDNLELLYFMLSGALLERLASPPTKQNTVDYSEIIQIEENLGMSGEKLRLTLAKMLGTITSRRARSKYFLDPEHAIVVAESNLYKELQPKVARINGSSDKAPPTPIQFTKEAIGKMGALGRRFLQLLPQIVDVSPKRLDELSEVYDQVKGQPKLSALLLLEREWPDFWEQVESVNDRIGGGSMVTVYHATMKDGTERALRVSNPNTRHHLKESYEFASSMMDYLVKQYGGAYQAARLALDDIKDWVEQDINLEGFMEQDVVFKEKYDGYTVGKSTYSIKIPRSYGPDNAYFSSEDYVEGINLTRWQELVEQGHDMKAVISLLTKFYAQQIKDGQVLSDVHKGNFSVTSKNKEIVVYDRNFFLNLSETESALITTLVNPFTSVHAKSEQLLNYLSKEDLPESQHTELVNNIRNFVKSLSALNLQEAQASIIAIKQTGGKIPLAFTLLLKNFNELQIMSKKAGFKSLIEALFY
ncbi:MAG: AarF/UbiB family protein [Candidatus Gracilibacteria bacterium]|nr:AarF/UbiB family protein [Candidatus Gracilibacteria bacterium]